jgi:hypothetical protein
MSDVVFTFYIGKEAMMKQQDSSNKQSRVENITLEIQDVLNELTLMQKKPAPLNNSTDLLVWELQVKKMTDRLRGLIVAQGIQCQLDKPDFKAQAKQVAQSSSKKNA